jgi:5-formyltetrahydrofolate cyclo-ligase
LRRTRQLIPPVRDIASQKTAARRAGFSMRAAAAHAAGVQAGALAAVQAQNVIARLDSVRVISAYLPIRSEIDPLPAMAGLFDLGHRICVPVIDAPGLALKFREWKPGIELQRGPFDVDVPASGDWLQPYLLLVPLLSFDAAGYRLGYGGGFYDRTIAALRATGDIHAFGFAFEAQRVDAVPREPTDERLDGVITEAGFYIPV